MKKFKKLLSVAISAVIIFSASPFAANAQETDRSVYVGGESFGVKFYTNGVIVIQLESYYDGQMYKCPAKDGGLKVNDIIKEANGEKITCNEDLQKITQNCNGNTVKLTIERNGNKCEKKITPVKNTTGVYLIGAWVRDSCAGIGTVTYYDSEKSYFAALGHGICDSDTSLLLPLASGETVKANISGITKSTSGNVGSLNGYFTDKVIGSLTKNTDIGIYGTIKDNLWQYKKKVKIAASNEVRTGKAQIYTTLNNDKVDCYDIKISKICNNSLKSNENFVITITDDDLLRKCGGIVQGMSGSPIIQNGKLVGAVTHVFVNSPNEGYGIFAQNMALNYQI